MNEDNERDEEEGILGQVRRLIRDMDPSIVLPSETRRVKKYLVDGMRHNTPASNDRSRLISTLFETFGIKIVLAAVEEFRQELLECGTTLPYDYDPKEEDSKMAREVGYFMSNPSKNRNLGELFDKYKDSV